MKKITILTLFAAFLFAGFSASAQEQGDIRVGLGLAIGTNAGVDDTTGETELGLGINFNGEYLISDVISIAPSYTSFFKTDIGGADFGFNAFNIDGRYYFGSGDTQLYGLVGFTSLEAKVSVLGITGSSSESGLNIGAGANLPIGDSLLGNIQAKYQTPGDGQLVVNVGVAYSF